MTNLRKQMREDLRRRNYAESTYASYIRHVAEKSAGALGFGCYNLLSIAHTNLFFVMSKVSPMVDEATP